MYTVTEKFFKNLLACVERPEIRNGGGGVEKRITMFKYMQV
jgi:hypothetical protein